MEIAWTVVPFLILIGMAVPATSTLLEIYDNEDAELDILVTGYQWKWKYEYLNENGENVSFFSNLRTSAAGDLQHQGQRRALPAWRWTSLWLFRRTPRSAS